MKMFELAYKDYCPGYPAHFSPDRVYRYTLYRAVREVKGKPRIAMFIGLNPSTADEEKNDPTVRRCMGYVKDWGYDVLCMTNLFAYRSTDPKALYALNDERMNIQGGDNNRWLRECAAKADLIVAAWGNHGSLNGRATAVRRLMAQQGRSLFTLGLTGADQPKHPLYLRATLRPQVWRDL